MRKLAGYPAIVVTIVAIAMSLYHIYARLTPASPDSHVLRMITLAFALVLAFALYPRKAGAASGRIALPDLVLAALSLVPLGYVVVNYRHFTQRMPTADSLTTVEMALGGLAILLVLEATRRTIGPSLPIVALGFIGYALFGPWMPGFLQHRGTSLEVLIDQTFYTTEGIFGIALAVAGSYVILFIIFGSFLEQSGAGQLFMDFANAIAGGQRGGPGKVSVVSSSLFGTISGSAVANVMVDGWLTIPLMKRTGFKPEAAAAIESVASTGGQIMPPIMGAASFVMAEFMGVPYSAVVIAALIPALFYYGALFAAIHFNAIRSGLRGIPREELPQLRHVLRARGHLFIPLLVIFVLLIQGYTATYAALMSTGSVIILSWLRADTRITLRKALVALRDGAEQTVGVAMATASAGIVIGVVLQTGLAIRFTGQLVDLSGGILLIALLVTMIAAIILGTGMPTTPAYIMLAALLIPAVMRLGVPPMAAHMFAFYFACLSAITPPVALAVYAAASIAKCGLWGAGWQAVKFAAAGFIVPFFFVYSPALLFEGTWPAVAQAIFTGTIGVIALAAGLEGYFIRPATWFERALFVAAALLLIDPGITTDLVGVALLVFGLGLQKMRPRAVLAPAAAVPEIAR